MFQIPPTFRENLKYILHTTKFQIGIVTLVIIDCIIVIAELMIDLQILEVGEESDIPHVCIQGW